MKHQIVDARRVGKLTVRSQTPKCTTSLNMRMQTPRSSCNARMRA